MRIENTEKSTENTITHLAAVATVVLGSRVLMLVLMFASPINSLEHSQCTKDCVHSSKTLIYFPRNSAERQDPPFSFHQWWNKAQRGCIACSRSHDFEALRGFIIYAISTKPYCLNECMGLNSRQMVKLEATVSSTQGHLLHFQHFQGQSK